MDAQEYVAGLRTVDEVWDVLVRARDQGDDALRRAAEGRMRELAGPARFAHLSDDELDARIRGLAGEQHTRDALAYSPGGGVGGEAGAEDTAAFNRAIRANQEHGVARTLAALLDERERRREAREG